MEHAKPSDIKELGLTLDKLIEQRRNEVQKNNHYSCQKERWGLALSGGGIRSSIFCYGLITALAKAKTFWRFDLMSTVSGGGYIGAMVGRMAQTTKSAEDLQNQLGALGATSHHRSWLRANSRYLTPRGSRDRLFAVVIFLRNLAGVHLELGILTILLGCFLGGIDVLVWWLMNLLIKADPALPLGITALHVWETVSKWPTLWLALPVAALWAIGAAIWYWYMPTTGLSPEKLDAASHKVTKQLAVSVQAGFAIVLLGIIDWVAWRLAKQPTQLIPLGTLFATILVVLRLFLPLIQQSGNSAGDFLRQRLPLLLDLAGGFGLLVLAIFWTSLVHAFATHRVWDPDTHQVDFIGAALALAIPAAISLAWIAISGRNLDFLNRSSLHDFYRSRLSSAYLRAANPQCKPGSKVTEVDAKDDVPFNEYTPHVKGGPVHIINVCVNQTYQREGLHNIDRQGDLMSLVGPGIHQVQGRQWLPLKIETMGTLGTWMAVSGAAAAPGMGSLTSPGLASILTTLGMRLGYWWRTGNEDPDQPWSAKWLPKYRGLFSELFAQFAGIDSGTQYLSDGGHSENTGVYPLLKAHCKLIVMADCGADPDYKFQDLENLIRRARIDMNVDIRFIKPTNSNIDMLGNIEMFGSLDDLASLDKPACLALARVDYPDDDAPGVLVLVKPNLTPGLPEDIYNYSRDYPEFPQETTIDQFFDESQWESYFSLGCHLGRVLDEQVLLSLAETVRCECWIDSRAKTSSESTEGEVSSLPPATTATHAKGDLTNGKSRRPNRIPAKSAAAAAGIGLGAIVSSASGLWVALENVQADKSDSNHILKPLYDTYGNLPVIVDNGQVNSSIGQMAAQLLTVWQILRVNNQQDLFLNNAEALDMLRTTYRLCTAMSNKLAVCSTLLQTFDCPIKPDSSMVNLNHGYWARAESERLLRQDERRATYCDPEEKSDANQQIIAAALATPTPHQAQTESIACKDITIFIQIYGQNGRDNVRVLRSLWRAAGASVPPIEDVSSTARRQGRSAPTPYGKPTVIYHLDDAKNCANELAGLAFEPAGSWDVIPLNKRFSRFPRTIEVWLPPAAVADGFGLVPIKPDTATH